MKKLFTQIIYVAIIAILCTGKLSAQEIYNISVSAMPESGGIVTGNGVYEFGTSVTITATPHPYYEFLYWMENDELFSANSECNIVVTRDMHLVAIFGAVQLFEVAVSANPREGGNVTGGGTFTLGATATVTAEAYPNFRFLNWTEEGNIVSTEPNYSFHVNTTRNLVANFVPSTIEIKLSKNIEDGGTVNGAGTYSYGQTVLVSAGMNLPEYMFRNWTEDGEVVSSSFIYSFTATHSRHLVANFMPAIYEISVYANPYEGGAITGGGEHTYGSQVTISAVASPGYQFLNWTRYTSGSGTVVSTEPNYTFEVLGDGWGNSAFVAYFEQEIRITILPNIQGGEVLGAGTYKYGDEVTLEAIPKSGYKFVNWMTESKSIVSTENPYRFTAVESLLLIANFEEENILHIEDNDTEEILVYPNPTTGELTIKWTSGRVDKWTSVEIFDASGKMQKAESRKQNDSLVINISHLCAGVYFIQLQTERGTVSKKFVKN